MVYINTLVYVFIYLMEWFPLLIQGAFSMLSPEGTVFCRLSEDSGKTNTQDNHLCKAKGCGDIVLGFHIHKVEIEVLHWGLLVFPFLFH